MSLLTHAAPPTKLSPEIQALIPPLAPNERQLLEENLARDGCRDSLVVWQEAGILLDGHNRHEICTRLGIPYLITELPFATEDDAKLWVIEHQLGRRNLTDIDRIALAKHREPLIRASAAANQRTRSQLPQKSAEASTPIETREAAAAAAGVSHDTYTKGKVVLEHGVPELVEAVRKAEVSINAAAEVATLPPDEQIAAVLAGTVQEKAKDLRSHRARNTGNDEWYTPTKYVEAARAVLGDIDVDPASNDIAQRTVRATTYYTKQNTGLDKPWTGRVWVNPPYSARLITPFVEKLMAELACGHTTACILLVNNQTEVGWFQRALASATAVCFPNKRVRFLQPNGKPSEHGALQGQTFFYFGPDTALFAKVFGEFGVVLMGNVAPKAAAA